MTNVDYKNLMRDGFTPPQIMNLKKTPGVTITGIPDVAGQAKDHILQAVRRPFQAVGSGIQNVENKLKSLNSPIDRKLQNIRAPRG